MLSTSFAVCIGMPGSGPDTLLVNKGPNRTRLNSHYLRELTHGKFIIKSEQISQLEDIGQGILCD